MSNVIPFPAAKIANTDTTAEQRAFDDRADRLNAILNSMRDRADTFVDTEDERAAMKADAQAVIDLFQ